MRSIRSVTQEIPSGSAKVEVIKQATERKNQKKKAAVAKKVKVPNGIGHYLHLYKVW